MFEGIKKRLGRFWDRKQKPGSAEIAEGLPGADAPVIPFEDLDPAQAAYNTYLGHLKFMGPHDVTTCADCYEQTVRVMRVYHPTDVKRMPARAVRRRLHKAMWAQFKAA